MVDKPNMISIEIHISDILKINDRDFSITFSLYFNVKWKEPRLRLNPSFFQNRSGCLLNSELQPRYDQKFLVLLSSWVPCHMHSLSQCLLSWLEFLSQGDLKRKELWQNPSSAICETKHRYKCDVRERGVKKTSKHPSSNSRP